MDGRDRAQAAHLIMRLDGAHQESKNKSDAVRGAKETALQLGGHLGGKPPFGFDMVPETRVSVGSDNKEHPIVMQLLQPNKFEAAIIRTVWSTIQLHMGKPYMLGPGRHHPGSLTGICADMNMSGVKTRGQLVGKKTESQAMTRKSSTRRM
ncbi:hypothetical protein ACWGKQ_49530 [Streptomyces sp. NPDC054770]